MEWLAWVGSGVLAIIGYFVGKLQDLRQRKLKAYEEEIPVLIKSVFEPTSVEDADLSRALVRMWLLASPDAARSISRAMSILVNPARGDLIVALQQAILAARKDVQFWPQDLTASDVSHFFINLPKKP